MRAGPRAAGKRGPAWVPSRPRLRACYAASSTGRAPTSPAGCTEPPPGRAPTETTDDAERGHATRSETGRAVRQVPVRDGVVDAGGSSERLGGGQSAAIDRVFLTAPLTRPPPDPSSASGRPARTLARRRGRAPFVDATAACHARYGCMRPSISSASCLSSCSRFMREFSAAAARRLP